MAPELQRDLISKVHQKPEIVREAEAFRFGTGKVHHSSFHVVLYFSLGDKSDRAHDVDHQRGRAFTFVKARPGTNGHGV